MLSPSDVMMMMGDVVMGCGPLVMSGHVNTTPNVQHFYPRSVSSYVRLTLVALMSSNKQSHSD